MKPLVSICMPHLNSLPFTEERMDTILAQTVRDWELIIVDSNSDDGSWEVLQRYADADPRIHLSQGPRDGMYPNLNRALAQCRGDYIYIATSDDTMSPDFLEQMIDALEQNPDCGLAHCCLTIIDEQSRPTTGNEAWENWPAAQYFGDWMAKYHVRQAPHDGLLHLCIYTPYTSLTQLLVRRRVFDDLGPFRTDCAFLGDFEWDLRVSLNENVVHVPQALATWRRHSRQATRPEAMYRARASGEFLRLRRAAVSSLRDRNPKLWKLLRRSRLNDYYVVGELAARRRLSRTRARELWEIVHFSLRYPTFSLRWFFSNVVLRRSVTPDFAEGIRAQLEKLGTPCLIHEAQTQRSFGRLVSAKVTAA